jgi:hypothetical protein
LGGPTESIAGSFHRVGVILTGKYSKEPTKMAETFYRKITLFADLLHMVLTNCGKKIIKKLKRKFKN